MVSLRDETTKAYKAMEEAFFKGDAEALSSIYTEEAEWLVPKHRPYAGDKQSHRPGRAGSATGKSGPG